VKGNQMNIRNGYRKKNAVCISFLIVIVLSIIVTSCATREVELDPALQRITTYKFGESREALTKVADLVTASYGFPSMRLLLEKQFAVILRSDATLECKEFICRQLWIMGTDVSVPELVKMLSNEKTSDIARYALENNPSPLAGNAFRDALKTAQGKALIGIINSLGERRDRECVEALKSLSTGSDEEVSSAAAAALRKIGN